MKNVLVLNCSPVRDGATAYIAEIVSNFFDSDHSEEISGCVLSRAKQMQNAEKTRYLPFVKLYLFKKYLWHNRGVMGTFFFSKTDLSCFP